jgi:hypothetical protein
MRTAAGRLAIAAALTASCGANVGAPTPVEPVGTGPRWTPPEKIDPSGSYDRDPQLAVSAGGEAVAVWVHDRVGGRGFLFRDGLRASRFTPGTGWTPSAAIPDTRERGAFDVSLDEAGGAVVLVSSGDGRSRVWATRAARGEGWLPPEPVQEGGGDAYHGDLVLVQTGLMLAAWSEFDGQRTTLWSRPLDERGWRRTQPIDLVGDTINSLSLVSSGRGQALAAWYEATRPGGGAIFANLFDESRGWSRAQQIGSAGTFPVGGFDASGAALVVWNTLDGVMMNRLLPERGWTGETKGPGGGRSNHNVSLAVGASGRALAAWNEQGPRAGWELWAAPYDPRTGWSAARQLSATEPSRANIVIDASGRGVVLWYESGFIIAHTYAPAAGWGRQERVGLGSQPFAGARPLAGIDAQGNVTVVWNGDGLVSSRLALGQSP